MNRNRLAIRLALIAVVIGVVIYRGQYRNRQMLLGFGSAIALVLVVTIVRAVMESSQKKRLEEQKQLSAQSSSVDLFTKPKDF